MKIVWILALILATIIGLYCFVTYKNSKEKRYLIGVTLSVIIVVLESMALIIN